MRSQQAIVKACTAAMFMSTLPVAGLIVEDSHNVILTCHPSVLFALHTRRYAMCRILWSPSSFTGSDMSSQAWGCSQKAMFCSQSATSTLSFRPPMHLVGNRKCCTADGANLSYHKRHRLHLRCILRASMFSLMPDNVCTHGWYFLTLCQMYAHILVCSRSCLDVVCTHG